MFLLFFCYLTQIQQTFIVVLLHASPCHNLYNIEIRWPNCYDDQVQSCISPD